MSGDVHYAEKMKVGLSCSDLGYPIYEFTSSGLTHSCDANVVYCDFLINKFFKHLYHVSFFDELEPDLTCHLVGAVLC